MNFDAAETLRNLLIATLGMAGLACGWLLVMTGWRRVFPDQTEPDDDVLASRLGCGACSCVEPCDKRRAERTPDLTHLNP